MCLNGIGFRFALLVIAVPGVSSYLLSSKFERFPAPWSSNYKQLFCFIIKSFLPKSQLRLMNIDIWMISPLLVDFIVFIYRHNNVLLLLSFSKGSSFPLGSYFNQKMGIAYCSQVLFLRGNWRMGLVQGQKLLD